MPIFHTNYINGDTCKNGMEPINPASMCVLYGRTGEILQSYIIANLAPLAFLDSFYFAFTTCSNCCLESPDIIFHTLWTPKSLINDIITKVVQFHGRVLWASHYKYILRVSWQRPWIWNQLVSLWDLNIFISTSVICACEAWCSAAP
jgi:hypothetical protein